MNQLVKYQSWRFLYAKKAVKKCLTKTGHPLPNVTAYVTTSGKDYSACLQKARAEAHFTENRLIGARLID